MLPKRKESLSDFPDHSLFLNICLYIIFPCIFYYFLQYFKYKNHFFTEVYFTYILFLNVIILYTAALNNITSLK